MKPFLRCLLLTTVFIPLILTDSNLSLNRQVIAQDNVISNHRSNEVEILSKIALSLEPLGSQRKVDSGTIVKNYAMVGVSDKYTGGVVLLKKENDKWSTVFATGGGLNKSDLLNLQVPNEIVNLFIEEGKQSTGITPIFTSNGIRAAMSSINYILKNAGIEPLGNDTLSIKKAKEELINGRGKLVSNSLARPGDLVIVDAGGSAQNIGICLDAGCTKVRSNYSYQAQFSWITNSNFTYPGSPYTEVTPEIWRIIK